ncbi:MAG TPA: SMI1/KNR4 family protein, partial [Ktedonobacterales bacterium]
MADLHWRLFLEQWSEDILRYDHAYRQTLPDDVVSGGWLGYRSASEAQLLAAERRLRTTLPPSYRSFLAVTNGWRMTSPFIYQVWAVEHIEWTAVLDPG